MPAGANAMLPAALVTRLIARRCRPGSAGRFALPGCSSGNAFSKARDSVFLAVDQEQAHLNRAARGDPSRQLRAIGMPGIIVDAAKLRRHPDFVALDANGARASTRNRPSVPLA